MDRDSKLRLFRKSLYAPHWLRVARDGLADQLARPPANRVGSHSHEILLNSSLESYSCRGRVAQLGEHLLCKQGVAGSIPATSTNHIRFNEISSKCASHTPCHSSRGPRVRVPPR